MAPADQSGQALSAFLRRILHRLRAGGGLPSIAARMLTLSEISKAHGARTLFADVSLQVNREDRIGLVGPNGAGKSTLFSIILGLEAADTGSVALQRGMVAGHLPQESAPVGDETVLELASSITPEIITMQRLLRSAQSDPHASPEALEAHSRMEDLGYGEIEARARQMMAGLAFREKDFARPAREMSGGWVMRAHLARLLVQQPDLLLLDEPTNHLDLDALLWFQDHLKTYPGGILMISHDREFLNQLITSVVEIRQGRLWRYRGNYDNFLEQREAAGEQHLAAWKNQQREIARLQTFVDRFRAKNTKASQAQSKLKQIERMDVIEAPEGEEATIGFAFPQPRRTGHKVIELKGVHFAYEHLKIYEGIDFMAERGQRIVLVGPNGAGKSTLLKLLAGALQAHEGERHLGYHVKEGYYSQYRVETLHPDFTVLEEASNTPQRVTETFVRTVLGSFLFRGDDVFKKVSVLSGGEKSRLALVKLLLDPPNLLLMDEPTTHLDIPSTDALLAALQQFEGTIIFISHDVYFIRNLANHVVHVENGRLMEYKGDYAYYVDKTAPLRAARQALAAVEAEARRADSRPAWEKREQKRRAAEERQALSRTRRAQQQLVHRLEKEIAALEARQHELTAALQDPATYADSRRAVEINQEMKETLDRLHQATAEWEQAATEFAGMEGA
jgi:ATP-binding cassette, subfamily F, member 3